MSIVAFRIWLALAVLTLTPSGEGPLASLTAGHAAARTQAFVALYQAHFAPIYAYLRSRLSDAVAAEDLTSEVFLRAWGKFDTTAGSRRTTAWLFTIARNLASDHYRRYRPAQPLDTVSLSSKLLSPGPEDAIFLRERVSELDGAIRALDKRERRVVALRFAAGLRHREIARILDTSEGNAAKILHRALQKLRMHFLVTSRFRP